MCVSNSLFLAQQVVDKRRLLELEEDKRRAEEDKLAALTALEKASHEFMNEKEEKRQLEVVQSFA